MAITDKIRELAQRFLFPNYATFGGFGYDNPYEPKERDQRDSYRGAFFRCIEIRAAMKAQAMLDAKVMRVTGQGEYEEVEPNHPWVILKNKPNPNSTAYHTYWWMSTSMDLMGHAHHIVLDVDGFNQPISLLPVYVDFGDLNPVPDMYGGVSEWVYNATAGNIQRIPNENVVPIMRPSPFTPYETFSLIQAAIFETDTDKFMKIYRRESVKDGGITSDVFSTDKDMRSEDRSKVAQELKKYKGRRGHNEVLVTSHGLKPVKYNMDMRDLQYIDGLIQNDKQLKFITGVPVPLFSDGSNRSVVEAAEREMIQYTIMPELTRDCEQLTLGFERIFGSEPGMLKIVPPDLKPLDEELEIRKRESYLRTGQRYINEYRAEDGKEDLPGGDVPMIQLGLVPLNNEEETLNDRFAKGETRSYERAYLDSLWRSIDKDKQKLESATKMTASRLFDEIEKEVKEQLNKREDFNADAVFDLDAIRRLVRRFMGPMAATILKQGFERGALNAGATGLEFSINNDRVQQTLIELANVTQGIADTTRDNFAKFVQDKLEQGETDITQGLRQFFVDEKDSRLTTISQIMTTAGYEAGQQVAYEDAGVTKMRWLSQRDGSVRETHLQADGDEVDIGTRFHVGSAALRFPGDPEAGDPSETINCRCSTLPIIT